MNNSQDPISKLEAHYERMRSLPIPAICVQTPIRWWEPIGGLAAGVAIVLLVISIGSGQKPDVPLSTAPILQRQMEQAGFTMDEPEILRHAQRESTWHA